MTNQLPRPTLKQFAARYGLYLDSTKIVAGDKYRFAHRRHSDLVQLPTSLPSITGYRSDYLGVFFLVPTSFDGFTRWDELDFGKIKVCEIFIPETDEWPDPAQTLKTVDEYENAGRVAEARELLKGEREGSAGLYASAADVEQEMPMLVKGLIRERCVSVIFGNFDEFKTTLVADLSAHLAAGVPWQGLEVSPRPVIWYALEGADEMAIRLRALEPRLALKNPAWGDDRLPISVLDRIPEDPDEWRAEISRLHVRWQEVRDARDTLGELPMGPFIWHGEEYQAPRYPDLYDLDSPRPIVVIDTLSLALGGEDEKGPRAAGFIGQCLGLMKTRPDLTPPEMTTEFRAWEKQHPGWTGEMNYPVASGVILIHHQTKAGPEFAGHRAIGADTHGLYRVRRFGSLTDKDRPFAGQLTPIRVKGIPRPAPVRFEVEIAQVEGTMQTAAVLKNKATAVPERLLPIVEALRELDDPDEIARDDLNACLDIGSQGKNDAQRAARKRNRDQLEKAGVLEPVLDEHDKVAFYRFHDPAGA